MHNHCSHVKHWILAAVMVYWPTIFMFACMVTTIVRVTAALWQSLFVSVWFFCRRLFSDGQETGWHAGRKIGFEPWATSARTSTGTTPESLFWHLCSKVTPSLFELWSFIRQHWSPLMNLFTPLKWYFDIFFYFLWFCLESQRPGLIRDYAAASDHPVSMSGWK